MPNLTEQQSQASAYYAAGLERVKSTPEPAGQKFHCGSRVHIDSDLGFCMSHFPSDCDATVEYVYAHAYGGDNIISYSLNVDGHGSTAWYYEDQLTSIDNEQEEEA